MHRVLALGGAVRQSANREGTYLGDPLEVRVDMNDTKAVMQGSLSDEQVGDWRAMPHPMMVRKVSLQPKRPLQNVGRSGDDIEVRTKVGLQSVIVLGRASGIELFKLAHRTHKQRTGQLLQLESKSRTVCAGCGALVEDPARYRHISSEPRTLRSARLLSR